MTQDPSPHHHSSSNDLVTVKWSLKPHCRVELEVHAKPALIASAKTAAIKSVGKEVAIPGFRKGKAPDEMIAKKYGASIDKEKEQKLADLALKEAFPLVKIPFLNNDAKVSYQAKKVGDEGADLLFAYETEPTVPTIDPSAFTPKSVERATVGEVQIEEAIRQTMFYFAEWKEIDRPIQEGDYIMIDLDTVENGVPTQVFHHVRFEVTAKRMAQWMLNLVVGASSKAVLEGTSEVDADATEEEKKEFKPKQVRITIVKAESATLPPLDDEFAKKVGAPNVEQLRQSVLSLLNMQADARVQEETREQVNHFLLANYPFELPFSLLETEHKFRLEQLLRDPQFKKEWDKMAQEERKKVAQKIAVEAEHAVRLFYLSRQIIRDKQISITQQEVQQAAIMTRRFSGAKESEQVSQEEMALAFSKVMLIKAQDVVLKQESRSEPPPAGNA